MRTRTLFSMIVARSSIMYCSKRCIRKLISVCGRFQFSLERQYSVSCSIFEPAAFLGRAANGFDAPLVAGDAGQILPLGPAAVAVHDDRDVPRPALGRNFQRPRWNFAGSSAAHDLLTTIVWSRSGPTETISIGWPTSSLMRRR